MSTKSLSSQGSENEFFSIRFSSICFAISLISPSLPLPLADPEYNGDRDCLLTGDGDRDRDRLYERFILRRGRDGDRDRDRLYERFPLRRCGVSDRDRDLLDKRSILKRGGDGDRDCDRPDTRFITSSKLTVL